MATISEYAHNGIQIDEVKSPAKGGIIVIWSISGHSFSISGELPFPNHTGVIDVTSVKEEVLAHIQGILNSFNANSPA
jgi:prephenate dehydrogenase